MLVLPDVRDFVASLLVWKSAAASSFQPFASLASNSSDSAEESDRDMRVVAAMVVTLSGVVLLLELVVEPKELDAAVVGVAVVEAR